MVISRIWNDIRNDISEVLEEIIDDLNPDVAERILNVGELLDHLSVILKGEKIWGR